MQNVIFYKKNTFLVIDNVIYLRTLVECPWNNQLIRKQFKIKNMINSKNKYFCRFCGNQFKENKKYIFHPKDILVYSKKLIWIFDKKPNYNEIVSEIENHFNNYFEQT